MESTDPATSDETSDAAATPVGSVWSVYKSRFVPTQTFVAVCCLLMYFAVGMQGPTVIAAWICMQFAAVWGAYTGKRLAERMTRR